MKEVVFISQILMEVTKERTGWRDNQLDTVLEKNGISPIKSFLVTEYNYGKSVAMIEYKRIGDSTESNECLMNYCSKRKNKEFYFIVLYDYESIGNSYHITKFIVFPKNDAAISKYGTESIIFNELGFIDFLYDIRNNKNSKYREEAHKEYSAWFELDVTFDIDKQVISKRHRSYAYDVPAADIDSMVCDVDNIPYLFVEYKENNNYGRKRNDGHNKFVFDNMSQEKRCLTEKKVRTLNNKAISDLGNGCKEPLPVLAVEYNLEKDIFSLYAFNDCAKEIAQLKDMTKEEYFKYIKEPKNFKKTEAVTEIKESICPRCGNKLEVRSGRYGKFYGCTGFKMNICRYTENYKEVL